MFFSYQNIFRQYPTNRKKIMTGFPHGVKERSQKVPRPARARNFYFCPAWHGLEYFFKAQPIPARNYFEKPGLVQNFFERPGAQKFLAAQPRQNFSEVQPGPQNFSTARPSPPPNFAGRQSARLGALSL